MTKCIAIVTSLSLVLWVCSGVVGCGGSGGTENTDPNCTGSKCDSYKVEPIAPQPWLSCWIEREDMGGGMGFVNNAKCQNVSDDDPVRPQSIQLNGGGELTVTPTVIGSFTDNYYPRKQQVDITVDGLNVWGFMGGWNLSFWIEASGPGSLDLYDPLILERPYWVWPVTVIAKNKMFAGQPQSYQIDIDPFFPSIGGSGSSSYKVEGMMTVVAEGKYQTIYFPVEKNTSFVKMQTDVLGSSNKSFNITGPGYYLAENGTMRVATADEIKKALETCEEGKKRCSGDSQTVEACTNGQWQTQVDCTQSSKSCVNGECISAPACEEGKTQCGADSQMVEICANGQWQEQVDCSQSSKSCVNGECVSGPACEEGKRRCGANSQMVEICTSGQWRTEVDCSQNSGHCVDGECVSASVVEFGCVARDNDSKDPWMLAAFEQGVEKKRFNNAGSYDNCMSIVQKVRATPSGYLVCVTKDNDGKAPYRSALISSSLDLFPVGGMSLESCFLVNEQTKLFGKFRAMCLPKDNDGRDPWILAFVDQSTIALSNNVGSFQSCSGLLQASKILQSSFTTCFSKDNDGRDPWLYTVIGESGSPTSSPDTLSYDQCVAKVTQAQ